MSIKHAVRSRSPGEKAPAEAPDPDELVESHLGLAYRLAGRFGGRGVSRDDLRQAAAEGLVKAAQAFDPERGVDFAAYATPTIIGMLKRYFRDQTWGVHVPRSLQERSLLIASAREELSQELQRSPSPTDVAERLGISVDEVIEGIECGAAYRSLPLDLPGDDGAHPGTGKTSDPAMDLAEDLQALRPLLRALPERDRSMLSMRFIDGMTQNQIAARMGVSQMQVSRLLGRCLGRLRSQMLAEV